MLDDPKAGPRYYSNSSLSMELTTNLCRVHPDFQCIVVVRQSEIDNIPPPFLNRFEKYSLTHKSLLEAVMNTLPAYLRAVVQRAQEKVCSHAVSTYTIYISKLSARCFVVLTQQ